MAASDELLIKLIETLAAEGCVTADFEMDAVGHIGRMRIARDRAIRDREAAELLPRGRMIAAEVLGVAPSTVYKMAHRHYDAMFSTDEVAA